MTAVLQVGHQLTTTHFGEITIIAELGSGAQGQVFKVDTPAGPKALKWYFPSMATESQRRSIQEVIKAAPDSRKLLWPEAFVEHGDGFGYIMPLRPDEYVSLAKLIKGKVAVSDTRLLIRGAIGLAQAFRAIQSAGLAYRDIKDPNIFIRPDTGDILVCDNDNCVAEATDSQIKGTTDFCAPEILVEGAAPTSVTDLHSLALLMFMLLVRGHPLDGARERAIKNLNESARVQLYGKDPLYIFDPDNDDNRPISGFHDRIVKHYSFWPPDLQELWMRAFTDGLRNPSQRPALIEWIQTLSRCHDGLKSCDSCSKMTAAPKQQLEWDCPWCKSVVQRRARAHLGDQTVLLEPGAALFPHHLSGDISGADFSSPAFVVTTNPANPSAIGLRNDTAAVVNYVRPGAPMTEVEPGRTARIVDGAELVTPQGTIELRF